MSQIVPPWLVWALASAVFAAATALFAKIGVADVPSGLATWIRTLVVVALLSGLLAVSGDWRQLPALSSRTWIALALSGLATGASWLCWFHALSLGDAARVAPIDKLSVVFVAVLATAFLGERLSGLNWAGVALIAVGATLVALR